MFTLIGMVTMTIEVQLKTAVYAFTNLVSLIDEAARQHICKATGLSTKNNY